MAISTTPATCLPLKKAPWELEIISQIHKEDIGIDFVKTSNRTNAFEVLNTNRYIVCRNDHNEGVMQLITSWQKSSLKTLDCP